MDIVCRDCGASFPFSEKMGAVYKDKGFHNPTRCPDCRRLSKVFVFDNLDIPLRGSPVGVVCPVCGVIYEKVVDLSYRLSDFAWRRSGYSVIICDRCLSQQHQSYASGLLRIAQQPRIIGGWVFSGGG